MLSLKELQEAFTQHVLTGDSTINIHVAETKSVPRDLRLSIYNNAYRERLIESLGSDFEMLQKLLGENAFRQLSSTYINEYPSTYYSLRWFGKNLPQFLGHSSDQGNHEWEAEMAHLEWQFIEAFDAANSNTVTEADAAAVPPESWPILSVDFHPSVRLLNLWWNTLDLWQAAKNDAAPPQPKRLPQHSYCLMWRKDLMTQYRSVEAHEAATLSAALNGANFSEICGALADELQDQEQVPMTAAGFLKGWLAAGMLVQLNY